MTFIIGRGDDLSAGPSGELGKYRALDGSQGAPLHLDLDGPHAMLVVGKRGYGKSYTVGVIAEALSRSEPVAPVVIDPMGVFRTLAEPSTGESVPAEVVDSPAVTPDSLEAQSWCALLGLDPESGPGGLVWQAAQNGSTLDEMRSVVDSTKAPDQDKRAALNYIGLAEEWGVFDADGIDADALCGRKVTVLDVSGLDDAPMNAVVRGVGESLYQARVNEEIERLPWLLIDEAHTFFKGVADRTLRLILTRGRAPGVSLVLATQRPSAVPEVGISQADVLISHRLTSYKDLEALQDAQPTYMDASLDERMPTEPGEVVIVDDSTETVHAAQIRTRDTPHGGDSPSASDVDLDYDEPEADTEAETAEASEEDTDAGETTDGEDTDTGSLFLT